MLDIGLANTSHRKDQSLLGYPSMMVVFIILRESIIKP
jgi:hypothetical protein